MSARVLLLCSSRFALQTMQELAYFGQLAAVAVPGQCDEWLEHATAAMQGSGIPILPLNRDRYGQELKDAFKAHQANLGLMASFSFKIPETVYKIPSLGFFNLHPGPLPSYRGPDPAFWMIRNREPKACVTLHQLDSGWDTGPVIMRQEIPLLPTDTYGLLSYKLSLLASRLTQQLIKVQSFGLPLPQRPQDESQAVYRKRQNAADVSIRWELMDAPAIIALINACNPWNKGATTRSGTRVIRFAEAAPMELAHGSVSGTIIEARGSELIVACAAETAIALRIIATDEGLMSAVRLTELGIRPGMRFEDL
jgi:methionyl-tRNA formyltransferase